MKSVLEAMTELVSRGYPKDTAYRIANGELPMDRASRMERAREQGYDPDDIQYHGTQADIKEFIPSEYGALGPGVYTTPSTEMADMYADLEDGSAIYPLLTRKGSGTIGFDDYQARNPDAAIMDMPEINYNLRNVDGITGVEDLASSHLSSAGDIPIRNTFDERDIRSVNAAFDPQYKGRNILGGTAATAVGAGALMAPNDASAAIEDVDIFEEESPMTYRDRRRDRRQRAQDQRERVSGGDEPLLSGAQTANLVAGLTGVAGVADIFGEYPEFPEGDVSVEEMVLEGQRGPSLAENLGEGNYLSAGLQTLGIIPLVGLGARAAAKALRSSNDLSAEQLSEFGKVLERAIDEKAPDMREIAENHPVVVEAMAQIGRIPLTNEAKGFGSPKWLENRVFQFRNGDEVEEVIGYDDAIDRLYDQSKSLAWTDDGLPYPGPATRAGDKTAVIVLGPPASGKSSISNPIARKYDATIIDSDEAKKLLPEYAGGVGANAVHTESKAIINQMEQLAIDEGDNLVIPTVGENADKIRAKVERYRNAGYNVQVVDVQVPAEEAAIRMFRRFYKTGRMIPTDYLNKVGNKPSATYDILRKEGIADGYTRIDNTVAIDQPRPVLEDTGGLLEGTDIRLRSGGRDSGYDIGKPGVSGSKQKTARATSSEEKGIGSL
jgi:predicted ABC-type ATPase